MNPHDLIAIAAGLAQPYSPSPEVQSGGVAAALITAAGNVYTGICIDTASSLGFCAEHAAIAEMLKAREAEIRIIVAVLSDGTVLAPCGCCRELIWQVHPTNRDTWVLLGPNAGKPLSQLLPDR